MSQKLLMEEYPKRPSFFAHAFVRMMTKAAVAQHIGPAGFAMLTVIAFQEDVCRYRRAVTYYDRQLMPLIGLRDNEAFNRARKLLVDLGWLHWSRSRARDISYYWVAIPDAYRMDFEDDRACDEGLSGLTARSPLDDRSIAARSPLDDRSIPAPFLPSPNTTNTTFTNPNAGEGGLLKTTEMQGGLAAPMEVTHPQSQPPTLAAGSASAPSEPPRDELQPGPGESASALASRLRRIGVVKDGVVQAALAHGHSMASIAAIVSHVEGHPGFWGGGYVVHRLTKIGVDVPAEEGWVKPDAKALAAHKAARARELQAEQFERSRLAPVPAETQQTIDWAAIEARYRDRIAATALADLKRMLPQFVARQLRTDEDRKKPAIRTALLRAFQSLDQREAVLT